MRYTATIKRTDGSDSTYTSSLDTTAGDGQALELARNLADSYGHELVSLKDADGKEIDVMGDQNKDTEERVEEQDKTTTERVEEQEIETREAAPNKTGDVRPNR